MQSTRTSAGESAARRLGTALLALLVAAAVGAFALAREVRAEPDIVNSVVVTPRLDPGPGVRARISFDLTRPDGRADVLVIDAAGNQVRALQLGMPLAVGPQSFAWDGRADDGSPVSPGDYRIEVILGEQGREIEPPGTIEVDG